MKPGLPALGAYALCTLIGLALAAYFFAGREYLLALIALAFGAVALDNVICRWNASP